MKQLIIALIILISFAFIFGCVEQPKACTQEAKLCPDGSAVGRVAPNCEFSPCPIVDSNLNSNIFDGNQP
jgi:hypothetical protein